MREERQDDPEPDQVGKTVRKMIEQRKSVDQ